MYIDKNYQIHFQIVYPNTFRIVVKQLLRTEENGYRDVSYYSLNQYTVNNYMQVTGIATGENFAFFIYRHFVETL